MNRRDYITLGATPPLEDCAQLGEPDYTRRALRECHKYIELIRRKMGEEPEGAELRIRPFAHDFGTYYEVVVYYDPADREAAEYALRCESDGPETWEDSSK